MRRTVLIAALASAALLVPPLARALDVRQPDVGVPYESELARAFVACTAPNTVTLDGKPACAPAVTSGCGHLFGDVYLQGDVFAAPSGSMRLWKDSSSVFCEAFGYSVETGLRYSADFSYAGSEAPCPSGYCTFADVVTSFYQGRESVVRTVTSLAGSPNGNFELHGLTVYAPDDLPIAAAGIGEIPIAKRFAGNLTVPVDPCTSGPTCDLAPWPSLCDFESGAVEIVRTAANVGLAHVTMRNVAGLSPLCRSGTYLLEATVRGTVNGCGTPVGLCTLPDTTITIPLGMHGRDVDGGGLLVFASHPRLRYASTQILGLRVIDPNGVPVAAVGVPGPAPLRDPRVKVKGDAIRVRASIPFGNSAARIDPVTDPGLAVAVSDRDGLVYGVTIPDVRWQLQSPVGSRWTYADKTGVLNGVRKARVKRIVTRGETEGYEVELHAAGVDLSAADHASLTVNVVAHLFVDELPYDAVREWQGTRTCRGAYPYLTCK